MLAAVKKKREQEEKEKEEEAKKAEAERLLYESKNTEITYRDFHLFASSI